MTKINRLVMKGFKSFANKTELVFGDSFNCILGPNGSGKSNVLDALCFVLGKSSVKGMRAEKSANLIYNGGKNKSPAKQGMVSIYFDNSSGIFGKDTGDEVQISRIVKQSGQSTYKINDKTRTRQQVLDLLSKARINPDGYNIILQGDIVQLVEMSSLERRGMVEEVAGINIYEEKKNKAMRELSRVEEKLNEASIILSERETYLKELKKEKNQAARFKELNDKLKQNKATIIHSKMSSKNNKLEAMEKKLSNNQEKISSLKKEIEKLQGDVQEKKGEIDKINKEVEKKGEKEQVAMHREVEKLKVDIALNQQRISTIDSELKKIDERKQGLDENYNELKGKIEVLEKEKKEFEEAIKSKQKDHDQIKDKIEDFKKKNALGDAQKIDAQIAEIDKKADELQEETHKLREEQQELLRDKDKLEIKCQAIDDKIEKVLGIEKENREALEKLKQARKEAGKKSHELERALDYDSSLSEQLGTARDKLTSRKEEESKLRAQEASIKESLAGGHAVRSIMELKRKGTVKGIIGSVSELGEVSDEYSLALEVAAGRRLSSIVTENDSAAAKCIKHLKDKKLGIATFLPLNKLRPGKIRDDLRKLDSPGVKGLALDLISFPEKYRKVFEYVFGNTLVVDNVKTARRVGIGNERMVTLSGDVIEKSGAMQGGYRKKRIGAGFQDKKIAKQLSALSIEVQDLAGVVANLNVKKRNNESRIEELRKEKAELEAEVIKLEKSLHLDSADLDANKKEKEKVESELKSTEEQAEKIRKKLIEKNKELTEMKAEKQKLREQLSKLRDQSLMAELNSFEQKKSELREEINQLGMELRNNESEARNVLGPEGENIRKILRQHEKEKSDFKKEKQDLQELIKEQKAELQEKEKAQKKFYSQFRSLFNKRDKLNQEISKLENKISGKEADIREVEQDNNQLSIDKAGAKAELSGLEEEYKEYEGVPLFKNKNEEQIKKEISQFEKMVSDIGAVNMKALEIYEKADSEYRELLQKKDKLTGEREDVLVMINQIDSKKKELFMRTYDVLNENFQRIFDNLTSKGKAYFDLEDEKDPFAGGMSIKVRITGTKYLDIRSLSGGEKTLTALAFIFAVQEYAPASFYVLDEVDAALDKHNSEKFAKLIRSYCEDAQYLIISHNDAVISEADQLYGISMGKNSTSKVTSLKI